jgi:prohibitin 2
MGNSADANERMATGRRRAVRSAPEGAAQAFIPGDIYYPEALKGGGFVMRSVVILAAAAVLGFFLLITALLAVQIIPTGEVGVLLTFGKAEAIMEPGLHIIVPIMNGMDRMKTTVQKYEVDATAASSDLQTVHATVAVNYRIPADRGKILALYTTFRNEHEYGIIAPLVQEVVKASTAKRTANELITNREAVKGAITNDLKAKLAGYNIEVVEVSITNFDFSPEFNKAIEAKMVAEQDMLKAQYELERKQIDVQRQIAEANATAISQVIQAGADAEARLIRAEAEAAAIRKITGEVNDLYIRYSFVQRWDGILPKVTGGNDVILDVSSYAGASPANNSG